MCWGSKGHDCWSLLSTEVCIELFFYTLMGVAGYVPQFQHIVHVFLLGLSMRHADVMDKECLEDEPEVSFGGYTEQDFILNYRNDDMLMFLVRALSRRGRSFCLAGFFS